MPQRTPQIESAEAHRLLRQCHTRRLDREGIPMVLTLVDERGELPTSTDELSLGDGRFYADLLGQYAALLVPEPVFRADDEGGLITAMQVLAYEHFEPARDEDDA
jgi:hypothetical protein